MLHVATALLLGATCMLLGATAMLHVASQYYSWRYEELMRHRQVGTQGYVYFIQLVHGRRTLVKIGRSVDPIKRIRALRTSAPYGVKVLGILPVIDAVKSEAMIHRRFAGLRIHKKNEWFTLTVPLLLYINAVSDKTITAIVQKAVQLK